MENIEKFNQHPIYGTINQFIDLLTEIAVRAQNDEQKNKKEAGNDGTEK